MGGYMYYKVITPVKVCAYLGGSEKRHTLGSGALAFKWHIAYLF